MAGLVHKVKSQMDNNLFWIGLMTLGMLIASIPGIIFAPVSISVFDEPYQILNAYDWRNAVYSPLASRLGNIYGNWAEWKYLYFRYLNLFLLFASIYIAGIFSLLNSIHKLRIVACSIIVTYLFFAFRGNLYWYCWDNWSTLGLIFAIVITLSLVNCFSFFNLFLLALVSCFTTLVRLPSVAMAPVCLVIILLVCRYHGFSINKTVWIILIYTGIFLVSVFLTLSFLYGNIIAYIKAFNENPVMAHSLSEISLPFLGYLLLISVIVCCNFIFEKAIGKIRKKYVGWARVLFLSLIFICILVLILPRRYGFDRLAMAILGIIDYVLLCLFLYGKKTKNKILVLSVMSIFFLSAVESIGSNMGYFKSLSWPVVPLIAMLSGNNFGLDKRLLFIFWGVAFVTVSVIIQIRYWNANQYLILNDSVLSGMRTDKELGEKIDSVVNNSNLYLKKGYAPIVLRAGNYYIWEYLFMSPNQHQKHLFNNWYAFWDYDYVVEVQRDIQTSQEPPLIVYMQGDEPEVYKPMVNMLQENAQRVLNVPGYSLWIKKE